LHFLLNLEHCDEDNRLTKPATPKTNPELDSGVERANAK
jgi:hypothetical protein